MYDSGQGDSEDDPCSGSKLGLPPLCKIFMQNFSRFYAKIFIFHIKFRFYIFHSEKFYIKTKCKTAEEVFHKNHEHCSHSDTAASLPPENFKQLLPIFKSEDAGTAIPVIRNTIILIRVNDVIDTSLTPKNSIF